MASPGRPKKPLKKRKESRVVVRVTADQKRAFERAAQRAGAGGVSTWLRMLAWNAVRAEGLGS